MFKPSGKEKVLKGAKGKKERERERKIKRHENDSRFPVESNARGKTMEQYV